MFNAATETQMSQASQQCREMVANGQAQALLQAMSGMLQAVGFKAMAEEIKDERDFARLQQYARIIIKNACDGKSKPQIMARFQLLGLI